MSDCIFCKIIAGAIPSSKVYEDARHIAFMDIGPIQPGHVLVVPKKHYARVTEVPEEEMADIARLFPKIARAVVAATNADGFNIHQTNGQCSGQSVPHVHFHIIPRHNDDGYSFHWKAGAYKPGEAEGLQKKIRENIG